MKYENKFIKIDFTDGGGFPSQVQIKLPGKR